MHTASLDTRHIKARAQHSWPAILAGLGIDPRYLQNRHGPCPACGGKDRFRFDDREGQGTFYCNQCGSGDGFHLLERVHGWSFRRPIPRPRVSGSLSRLPTPCRCDRGWSASMKRLFSQAIPWPTPDCPRSPGCWLRWKVSPSIPSRLFARPGNRPPPPRPSIIPARSRRPSWRPPVSPWCASSRRPGKPPA